MITTVALLLALGAGTPSPVTAAQLHALTYTTADRTVYVDSSIGSDANNCTAATASVAPSAVGACSTIPGALGKIPRELRHLVTVQLAVGTASVPLNYSGAIVQGFRVTHAGAAAAGLRIYAPLVNAIPATGTATGTATSATTGSVTTATFSTLTDSTQTWTVDNLKGKILEITAGTGVGQTYVITANTATTVTVAAGGWAGVPSTSSYAIRDWGAVINSTVSVPPAIGATASQTAGLLLTNLQSPQISSGFQVDGIKVNLTTATYGLAMKGATAVQVIRSSLRTTSGSTLQVDACISCSFTRGLIYFPTGTPAGAAVNSGKFTFSQALMWGNGSANGFTFGIADTGSLTFVLSQSQVDTAAFGLKIDQPGFFTLAGVRFIGIPSQAIRLRSTSGMIGGAILSAQSGVDVTNCGTAVEIQGPSFASFSGILSGTGNTSALVLNGGGRMQLSATSTVTGTTEVTIDGTNYTIANMRAASPKLLSSTLFTILHE